MMGSGASCSARCKLPSDQLPQRMTGPLVSVNAPTNTITSGSIDAKITSPTVPVNSSAAPERTRTGAGARPCVMV